MQNQIGIAVRRSTLVIFGVFMAACMVSVGCSQPKAKEHFSDPDVIALVIAAEKDDIETIDRLVTKGVDVNTKGKKGVTPLLFAMHAKKIKAFKRLLEHGANPNIQKEDGSSAISIAAKSKDSEWLELVLKHKGNPNLVDSIHVYPGLRNKTPLFNAIDSRNLRNVELLIKAGSNINHQYRSGNTPLMHAATRRWYTCVLYLLESGANFNLKNKFGQDLAFTSIFKTVVKSYAPEEHRHREEVLRFLKKKGVDLELRRNQVKKHHGGT